MRAPGDRNGEGIVEANCCSVGLACTSGPAIGTSAQRLLLLLQ